MKKQKRIFIIGLLVLCLVSGIAFSAKAEDNIIYNTDDIEVGYSEFYKDISGFRNTDGDKHTAPPAKERYVFAGWYSAQTCAGSEALSDADIVKRIADGDTSAYAKFVSADILSVKAQLKADTDSTTESTTLRFVTTVDCLDYMEVGFTLVLNGETYEANTEKVYRYLYYVGNTSGASMKCTPQEFHAAAKYFMACNLNKIPADYFKLGTVATPYWVTCDGTRVNSSSETKTVEEGMPLVCETKVTAAGGEIKYYSTLEKAFTVAESGNNNIYLEDGYAVEIIQDAVEIDDTLSIYDSVTLKNEEEREVTITRSKDAVFVDNLSTGLTIEGVATTVNEGTKGSLTFVGTTGNTSCIDSDEAGISNITLRNITMRDITSARNGGGVIRTAGTATITNCEFKNITHTGSAGGGAIYHISGSLEATECTFEGITSTAYGGAIYIKDSTSATVTSSEFDNIDVDKDGGAIYIEGSTDGVTIMKSTFQNNDAKGNGGAINVYGDITVNIEENCTFTTNGATGTNGGGAIYVRLGNVTIKGADFETNSATNKGGAIYVHKGKVTVQDSCTFMKNKATIGGAIFVNDATFNIKKSNFTTNTSSEGGGAVYIGNEDKSPAVTVQDGCMFTTNTATTNGGAVYVYSGTFEDTGSTYTGNTGAQGGAIRIDSTITSVEMTNTSFESNTAINNGGAMNAQGAVTLNACTFNNNNASAYGGAILVNASLADNSSTFTKNSAKYGGAVYVDNKATEATGSGSTFSDNTSTESGGAVYIAGGTVTAKDGCKFNTNTSTKNGGAVCVFTGIFNDVGSTYKDNTGNHGGAIRIETGITSITIDDSKFIGNETRTTAAYNGGALNIQAASGKIQITNVLFQDNMAANWGGAIYTNATTLTVSGCTFESNTSANDVTEAAAYNGASSELKFTNTTLINQTTDDFSTNIVVETISDAGDGYQLSLLSNIEERDFEAYCSSLASAGYTLQKKKYERQSV